MPRALIQTKVNRAIISSSSFKLITDAITHWIVLNAYAICLSFCIRTVVFAVHVATIRPYILTLALALLIHTTAMLRAMIGYLRCYSVYIDENQRIRTILEFTGLPIVSILACAPTRIAATITIAIFPAIVQRQHVDVFRIGNYSGIFGEGLITREVETLVFGPEPHVLPPTATYVAHAQVWYVLIDELLSLDQVLNTLLTCFGLISSLNTMVFGFQSNSSMKELSWKWMMDTSVSAAAKGGRC